MNPSRLAWLDLTRHKHTTFIALLTLGLTIGFAGILLRLNRLAESRFAGIIKTGDALVGAKSSSVEMFLSCFHLEGSYPGFIPSRLYHTLLSQEKVGFGDAEVKTNFYRLIVPIVFCGKYSNYRIIGTSEAFLHQPSQNSNPALTEGEWIHSPQEIVVGFEVAHKKKLKVGDMITASTWVSNYPKEFGLDSFQFKVVGILSKMHNVWDRALFTDLKNATQMLSHGMIKENTVWGSDVINYLIVYLFPDGMGSLQSLINQRTVAQVIDNNEAFHSLESFTSSGKAMSGIIILFVLLLGGLSMSGIMIARLDTKKRQINIFRAMGFEQKELLSWLAFEGLFLGLGALVIGILIDVAFFPFFRYLLNEKLPSVEEVSSYPWESSGIWILALISIMLSASLPLWLFNRTSSRKALQNLSE